MAVGHWALIGYELDEVGVYLDGGGEVSRDFHNNSASACTSHLQQAATHAVERSSDYIDGAAIHIGDDFLGAVVYWAVGSANGSNEPLHVVGADSKRLSVWQSVCKTVLKRWSDVDHRVEVVSRCEDEKQVGNVRHALARSASAHRGNLPPHRGEHFKSVLNKLLIGRELGVRTLKVAHHKPLTLVRFVVFRCGHSCGVGAILLILPECVTQCCSSSCGFGYKSSGQVPRNGCICFSCAYVAMILVNIMVREAWWPRASTIIWCN